MCGTASNSHWYKISKGRIKVMCCGNTGHRMTGKVKSPQMLIGAKINHTHQWAETESNMHGYRVPKTDLMSIPPTQNFGLPWNREDYHRRQCSQQIMPLLVQVRLCWLPMTAIQCIQYLGNCIHEAVPLVWPFENSCQWQHSSILGKKEYSAECFVQCFSTTVFSESGHAAMSDR